MKNVMKKILMNHEQISLRTWHFFFMNMNAISGFLKASESRKLDQKRINSRNKIKEWNKSEKRESKREREVGGLRQSKIFKKEVSPYEWVINL
jgi:hypothetical protein